MASAEEVRREEVELEKRRADAVLTACNLGIAGAGASGDPVATGRGSTGYAPTMFGGT